MTIAALTSHLAEKRSPTMVSSYPSRSRAGSTDLSALKRRLASSRPPAAPQPPRFEDGADDDDDDDAHLDPLVRARVHKLMREMALTQTSGQRVAMSGPGGSMVIDGNGNVQIAGAAGSISITGSQIHASNIRSGGSVTLTAQRQPALIPDPDPDACHDPTCESCNPDAGVRIQAPREVVIVKAPTPERKGLGFWGFLGAATVALIVIGSAPWWVTAGAAVGVAYVLRADRIRLAELETRAAEARAVDYKDRAAQAQLAAADPEFAAEFDRRPRA